MATKYIEIDNQEFKIWLEKYKKTTVGEIWRELQDKGKPLSQHTIGNVLRTGYSTYRTYTIMAEYFGTLQEA